MASYPDASLIIQPTRRRIVEHLRLLPGDHFRSIVRSLHLSLGSARYHLTVLTKGDLLRSETIGGRVRYFVNANGPAPPMNETLRKYWMYRDLRARVWSTVVRDREVRPSTVAKSLGVSRQLAAYHLRCLAELGLVVRSHGWYRAVSHGKTGSGSSLDRGPPHGARLARTAR